VFVAKDPKINAANYTKTDLYFIPLDFTKSNTPSPQIVQTGNLKGYSASPVFSPDGKSVAFTRMKSIQYESDKPRLLLIPDVTDLTNVQEFYETTDGEGGWDSRPESISWSWNGEELYVTAEENGRGKLFKLPASPRHAKDLPKAIVLISFWIPRLMQAYWFPPIQNWVEHLDSHKTKSMSSGLPEQKIIMCTPGYSNPPTSTSPRNIPLPF
jgi:hypothetical protein